MRYHTMATSQRQNWHLIERSRHGPDGDVWSPPKSRDHVGSDSRCVLRLPKYKLSAQFRPEMHLQRKLTLVLRLLDTSNP